jgi:glutathione S-transferase
LLGDQFSVVDAYAFYTLRSWQHLAKVDLGNFPVLQAYFARLMERPFVKAALSAERSNA